jgi:hypothetical protein
VRLSVNQSRSMHRRSSLMMKDKKSSVKLGSEIVELKSNSKIVDLKSNIENLIEPESQTEENKDTENEIKRIMYSPSFLIFIVIIFIKSSSATLMTNCFKILADKIIKNDSLASTIYAICTFADIFGRFAVPYFWDTFGFYLTHVYQIIFNMVCDLSFVLIGYREKYSFIVIICFMNLSWAFGYLLGHITIFGLYKPDVAVGIERFFDVYYILQSLLGVILTHLFISHEAYQECFLVILVFEFIFFVVFYKYYENFGKN